MNVDYIEALRDGTAYPTFRKIVGFFTIVLYVLAGFVAIGSILSSFESSGATLLGLILAVVIYIFARVGKEMSLMLADIADAALDVGTKIGRLKEEKL